MLKIVISYPTRLTNEIALVNEVLRSDVDFFHIRKPEFEAHDLEKYIECLDEVYHNKIVIHNHYSLMNTFNIAGIHLHKKNLFQIRTEDETDRCFIEPLLLRKKEIEVYGKRPDIVSYSAHSFSEIEELWFRTDYLTLSPVYDSISKTGHMSKFRNHKVLRDFLGQTRKKVIALGGVRQNNVKELKDLGFSGYAILGDLWENHN